VGGVLGEQPESTNLDLLMRLILAVLATAIALGACADYVPPTSNPTSNPSGATMESSPAWINEPRPRPPSSTPRRSTRQPSTPLARLHDLVRRSQGRSTGRSTTSSTSRRTITTTASRSIVWCLDSCPGRRSAGQRHRRAGYKLPNETNPSKCRSTVGWRRAPPGVRAPSFFITTGDARRSHQRRLYNHFGQVPQHGRHRQGPGRIE